MRRGQTFGRLCSNNSISGMTDETPTRGKTPRGGRLVPGEAVVRRRAGCASGPRSGVGLEGWKAGGGQAGRPEIRREASRPRLVQMHIDELGADIETLERRPDKVGADPRFLQVRHAHRAAEAVERVGRIVHFKIRTINRRTQDREPIMLVGAGNVPAPLLFAGAAAGEDAVGIDLWVPAGDIGFRYKSGARKPVLTDRTIPVCKIIARDIAEGAFFIGRLQPELVARREIIDIQLKTA